MFPVVSVCQSVILSEGGPQHTAPAPHLCTDTGSQPEPPHLPPSQPDRCKLVQFGPHHTGTPPPNFFTIKHGLSESGRLAFNWNVFLCLWISHYAWCLHTRSRTVYYLQQAQVSDYSSRWLPRLFLQRFYLWWCLFFDTNLQGYYKVSHVFKLTTVWKVSK